MAIPGMIFFAQYGVSVGVGAGVAVGAGVEVGATVAVGAGTGVAVSAIWTTGSDDSSPEPQLVSAKDSTATVAARR